jgi:hypothetical protein
MVTFVHGPECGATSVLRRPAPCQPQHCRLTSLWRSINAKANGTGHAAFRWRLVATGRVQDSGQAMAARKVGACAAAWDRLATQAARAVATGKSISVCATELT